MVTSFLTLNLSYYIITCPGLPSNKQKIFQIPKKGPTIEKDLKSGIFGL